MGRSILIRTAAALCLLAGLVAPARAASLSPEDERIVAKAETYLDGIETLTARFLQVDASGGYSEGTVYMRRPGRIRLEYDPPIPLLLIADGTFLASYDREMDTVSHMFLRNSPADILLAEDVDLNGDRSEVVDLKRDADTVEIELVKADDVAAGRLTLVFTADPFRLRQWRVLDAEGNVTTVSLFDARTGMELPDDLFRIPRPTIEQ